MEEMQAHKNCKTSTIGNGYERDLTVQPVNNLINILNGLEYLYPEKTLVSQIKRALVQHPQCENALVDALSIGQLKSKTWLVDTLAGLEGYDFGTVFLCAGWYATLAHMILDNTDIPVNCIRSFDIDPSCASIAETINRPFVLGDWRFKATTADIHDMSFENYHYTTLRSNGSGVQLCETADTVINTSCEHIENFSEWYAKIPAGTIVILQSNDYFELPEHINCVKDQDDFALQAPMEEVIYSGSLVLDKYTRYMRIGIK